jgi:hypothetical protein
MERASRPAVGVRRVSERRVVQRVRCDIERRRRPGRIGGRARIIPGAAPDLFRRRGGLLPACRYNRSRSEAVNRDAPERPCAWRCQPQR